MRPLTPPEKPYTNEEIAERVWQHFFREKNTRAYIRNVGCRYGFTGCAVGCMLTFKDATNLEKDQDGSPTINNCIDNLTKYFKKNQLNLLSSLQCWHDETTSGFNIDSWNELLMIFENYSIPTKNYRKELNETQNQT